MLAWQQRLAALGYWPGEPDGVFGLLTQQATYALEKASGLPRDGRADPAASEQLRAGSTPRPRSTDGRVVEIDRDRQLLLIVDEGVLLTALNTSTGSGRYYVHEGRTRIAVTPRGHYRIYAEIDGLRRSPLGLLWRPRYFNGGIALHGATSVPPWPDSHGCVRVSYAAIDRIWEEDLAPIGTEVWVY